MQRRPGREFLFDVRVDRTALTTLLATRPPQFGSAKPFGGRMLELDTNMRDTKFTLVALDMCPHASGPEAELTYAAKKSSEYEQHALKRLVEELGLAVLAIRWRGERED